MITDEAKLVKALAYAESVGEASRRKLMKEEAIERLRGQLELTGAALGVRVSQSQGGDALPDGVAKLFDLIRRYCDELVGYADEVQVFNLAIDHLEPLQAEVLALRYLELLEWKQIADRIGYSEQHTYRVREAALIGLYDHMPEAWRSRKIPDAET